MFRLNQAKTPLFDALLEYSYNNTIPYHVPGHKRGQGMDEEFRNFVGYNVLSIDVTVFDQVDSLHKPTGVIKEAQELAADAYGADATLFCIHGTSGAIQAMIMSAVGEGDKIIVPRNIHKSVTAGIILSGAIPVYVQPAIDKNIGVAMGVTPEAVKEALEENPDAKAVLIINPTYYGVASDIKSIARIVHSYDIPLLVDEAHGPHLRFNDRLPISALEAGADIVAQSTHKILGAMTQASMLHIKGDRISINRAKNVMSMLQTTSPSYILLASLDVARRQMALHGKELLDNAIDVAEYARKRINEIDGFYCFGRDIIGQPGVYDFDPTKVTITARNLGITGYELETILAEKYFIQPELADMYNTLCVMTLGDDYKKVDKLIEALKEISNEYYLKYIGISNVLDIPEIPEMVLTPREAYNSATIAMSLEDSVGQISAEFIYAYPPGIPVLYPGERITREIVEYVEKMKDASLHVQGPEDQDVNYIKVVRNLEALTITA
ncbi:aminotransferase class I/II-fold pyridoxal phosphate-dependent enzyme [Calorimonas adulescens]|uniref:Aminotransferase class I/II-fold pyridoxal phosphate-dependent enzyme n=1 Tax=Calorimonas adulescens TaxID=2606906 RepID=A0A5D8QG18_9THEO|nr:aminotransferase class I/II-fold pyridoxal phosphate-dependent enzyme [Calorimonas adulescens]TZE83650.1 aminotransferase class I/II-fold pyridoxal phosphate-dependent enzyme [Calorimonas adulescens]